MTCQRLRTPSTAVTLTHKGSVVFFLNLLRLQLKHVNHLETEIQICEKLCHHGAYESAACAEVRPHPETPHPEQVL